MKKKTFWQTVGKIAKTVALVVIIASKAGLLGERGEKIKNIDPDLVDRIPEE